MIDDELRELLDELRSEIDGMRSEVRGEFATLRKEMREGDEVLRAALRAEIAAAHIETRRHIDVVNEET